MSIEQRWKRAKAAQEKATEMYRRWERRRKLAETKVRKWREAAGRAAVRLTELRRELDCEEPVDLDGARPRATGRLMDLR